jgi:maleate cis-trans isomerase
MPVPSTAALPPTVGILYPGYSAEDDYPRAERRLGDGSRLPLVHTVMREDAHRVDALLDVGSEEVLADGAEAVAAQAGPLDSIMWACTSGSFVFGWDGAAAQVEALEDVAQVPASSTSFAFVDACRRLGIDTVAVGATYPDDVAARFVEFLGKAGIRARTLTSRGIVTAAEVGTLTGDVVLEFAAAVAADPAAAEAQAILMPDTALHTIDLLDRLDERVGKPVLTANQVSVWQGLRLAGADRARPRLGALFAAAAQAG